MQRSEIFNEVIRVKMGEIFSISLKSNPTTGYQWKVYFETEYLQLIEKKHTTDQSGLVGSGGADNFKFKAIKVGQTEIRFDYLRDWEIDEEPIGKRVYEIEIE